MILIDLILGALLVWLLTRNQRHARELEALRQEVRALKMSLQAPAPVKTAPPPAVPAPAAVPSPPAAAELSPTFESSWPVAPDEAPALVASVPPPRQAPPPSPAFDWPEPIRRWLFGGNTIVKLGVGVLFLGLAFLAKFASEHFSTPIELKLGAVGAAAALLLALGWRLREKRPAYAQVLQGGAVAALYLTLYAAARFYALLSPGPAFVLMVLIATLAATLALLQDALALAAIGALGGFATPLLLSTGHGDAASLFGYYLLINLGLGFMSWRRGWRQLGLLGFYATLVIASAWGVLRYTPADYAVAQGFLAAFFLLFVAMLLVPPHATAPPLKAWWSGSLLFGLPTVVFALQLGLVTDWRHGGAWSAAVLALFYLGLSQWLRRRPAQAEFTPPMLAISLVFATLVLPLALDATQTSGAWALEGAALVWLGLRRGLPRTQRFGIALLLFSGLACAWSLGEHGLPGTPFNAWLLAVAMLVAGSAAASCFVHKAQGRRPVEWALLVWAGVWLGVALAMEIDRFVPEPLQLSTAIEALAWVALLCTLLAHRLRWPAPAQATLALLPLLWMAATTSWIQQDTPLQKGGAWAWAAAWLAQGLSLHFNARHWPQPAVAPSHTGAVLLLAGLAGWQLHHEALSLWPGSDLPRLAAALPALALLAWVSSPRAADRWPQRLAPEAYRQDSGALLWLGLVVWSWAANAACAGTFPGLPALPLLNPLDAMLVLALWLGHRWMATGLPATLQPRLARGLLWASAFITLNAMLLRGFHHYTGLPYELVAWWDSLAAQTGLSLLWSITALGLMWWAARHLQRTPWMLGAALLGVVLLKLMLVDLSGHGGITRIVSFLGVGVLMLVIGYVAPLPRGESGGEAPR